MRLLIDNALESWKQAVYSCNQIRDCMASFTNRKIFVASLHNAVELFFKQYMLDCGNHNIARQRKWDNTSKEIYKKYLQTNELNAFFYEIRENPVLMSTFETINYSGIKKIQEDLFREFYRKNPEINISKGLNLLQKLRNSETHFFIDESDFLCDEEFIHLHNLMANITKLLVFYNLLPPRNANNDGLFFEHDLIETFSVKENLIKSKYLHNLQFVVAKSYFPSVFGRDAYGITETLSFVTEDIGLEEDDLFEFINLLLKYKILSVSEIEYHNSVFLDYKINSEI